MAKKWNYETQKKKKVDSFVTALYCHIVTDLQGYICREDKDVRWMSL